MPSKAMKTVHQRNTETGELEKIEAPTWPCPVRHCNGQVYVEREKHQSIDTEERLVGYVCLCTERRHEFFVVQGREPTTHNRRRAAA